MSFSFSKVKSYVDCPYKYYLRYIKRLKPKPTVDPSSPLILGTAVHEGIETRSIEKAIEKYKSNYNYMTPLHEYEISKLKKVLARAISEIPEGEYEVKLEGEDGFVGYIDCLVPVGDGLYDILDFKYSNNESKYKKSGQVHVYKHYLELTTDKRVRNICYVFIPKISTPDEEVPPVKIKAIDYNPQQITMFNLSKAEMDSATEFEKKPNQYCSSCDYRRYCLSNGEDLTGLISEEVSKEPTPVSLF